MNRKNQGETELTLKLRDVVHAADSDSYPGDILKKIIINDDTTIASIIEIAGLKHADLSHYYNIYRFYYARQLLPYLLTGAELKWQVPYAEATITDFMVTHGILDNTVTFEVGIPEAGGWELITDADKAWELAIRFIVTIQFIYFFVRWIYRLILASKLKKDKKKFQMQPDALFSLILSIDTWDVINFSKLTGFDEQTSKILLSVCGYKRHKKITIYTKTSNHEEAIQKLSEIYSIVDV